MYMTLDEYRDSVRDDVYRAIREYDHDCWAAMYMDGVIRYLDECAEELDGELARAASCLLDSLQSIGIGKGAA